MSAHFREPTQAPSFIGTELVVAYEYVTDPLATGAGVRRRQKSIKYDNERISLLNVYNKLFPLMENCMEDMKTTQKCKTKEDLVVFTLLNKK